MSTFRYDSGAKREVFSEKVRGVTIFFHFIYEAKDATMAVKFLKKKVECELLNSKSTYEKFLRSKLSFVVITKEDVDQRLVDFFATDEHIPVQFVTMKDYAEFDGLRDRISPVVPSDLSLARMKRISNVMKRPLLTCLKDEVYDDMINSFTSTPDKKKHKWRYNLIDGDGVNTEVFHRNGIFYDTNVQTGKLQKVSRMPGRKYQYYTEAGDTWLQSRPK